MNITDLILLFTSVMIGALVVQFFKPRRAENIQLLLTFSGAYLLAISMLHLLPELFKYNTTEAIGIYIFLGFLLQIILEHFSKGIEHGHFHKSHIIPFSVLISLSLHAFLEGIPLGSELETHTHDALLYGVLLHKMPVAIVLMTFFLQSNMKKSKAYALLLIFALMSPLGVYAGNLFENLSLFQDQILGIVIGIFIHISTTILFESSNDHKVNFIKLLTIIIAGLLAFLSLH